MHIPHILATGLDVVMNGVGRYGANLHQAVVLDEDRVTRKVTMHDGWHAAVKIAEAKKI